MTLTFDHIHDLDHGFSWSNFEIAVSQNGRADWHCTKGPRSGVWIYQIVTRVTSVVGVLPAHLVASDNGLSSIVNWTPPRNKLQ